MRRCPWWIRWWHRRLRRIDVQVMAPLLRQAAANYPPGAFARAWAAFKTQPGQEHWRCECYYDVAHERASRLIDAMRDDGEDDGPEVPVSGGGPA